MLKSPLRSVVKRYTVTAGVPRFDSWAGLARRSLGLQGFCQPYGATPSDFCFMHFCRVFFFQEFHGNLRWKNVMGAGIRGRSGRAPGGW
jgi:hypothetical protein